VDGVFAAQEQYVKLALNGVDDPAEMLRNQAEIPRRMVEAMAEQSRKQWKALQALAEESIKSYIGLFYASILDAPNPSRSRDERGSGDKNSEPPIKNYDRLSVEEVTSRLRGLSAGEVKELKAYEKNNQNRSTLVERFDRSLV